MVSSNKFKNLDIWKNRQDCSGSSLPVYPNYIVGVSVLEGSTGLDLHLATTKAIDSDLSCRMSFYFPRNENNRYELPSNEECNAKFEEFKEEVENTFKFKK